MTSINSLLNNPAELVKQLGEELIWRFPPDWVELGSELDVPREWVAVVRTSFADYDEGEDEDVIQTWDVWVGHDDTGAPIAARLIRAALEIRHSGWSSECQHIVEGDELVDYEEDNEHIHRRWPHAAPGRPTVTEGADVDPLALIGAIAEARLDAGLGEDDDLPLKERWRRVVVELMRRKLRVPPEDLLPLLADGTIEARWGSGAAWLNQPEALAASKVSVRCRPNPESDGADYGVRMRFTGQLEESGREACGIADDLADMLSGHYCRTFDVHVTDSFTGIRGRSGMLR